MTTSKEGHIAVDFIIFDSDEEPQHKDGCDCIKCEWERFVANHVYGVPFERSEIVMAEFIASQIYHQATNQLPGLSRDASDWTRLRNSSRVMPLWSRAAVRSQFPIVKRLDKMVKAGGIRSMVDIGCGVAEVAIFMQSTGRIPEVTAGDISAYTLGYAKALANRVGANIDFRLMRAEDLPLPSDSHNIAMISRVLKYSSQWAVAVTEAARVATPGGHVILLHSAEPSDETMAPITLDGISRELLRGGVFTDKPDVFGQNGNRTAVFSGRKAAAIMI